MSKRRDTRRLAMQIMYQIDMRGSSDLEAICEGSYDGPDGADVCEGASALAAAAWKTHSAADSKVTVLAPKWPTYRQPPVDRAILRLAYHEIITGRAPVKVAINEAVELAKEFGAKESPSFINAVLDRLARQITPGDAADASDTDSLDPSRWLADAVHADADGDSAPIRRRS